ncbi:MAG: hypothetical protein MI754_10125, partial [Chromatiales bacterium]|nr:hypothetical protein [Chromatiales bacterium]
MQHTTRKSIVINGMTATFSQILFALLISALTLIACNPNGGFQRNGMKPADKERLFKMILDHPDFQQYLHPELEDRVPLKVKSNSELGTNLS